MSAVAPSPLRSRVARELSPVRPLLSPGRRAAWLSLLAAGTVLLAWLRTRGQDGSSAQGLAVAAVEWAAGLAMVWVALREAVPGLGLGRARAAAMLGGGLAVQLAAAALLAGSASESWLGTGGAAAGLQCVRGESSLGLPLLAVAIWLLLRAFPLHARLASALAGGAAGLFADACWHLVCSRTDFAHLALWHFGSTVLLALAGYAAGAGVERRIARLR